MTEELKKIQQLRRTQDMSIREMQDVAELRAQELSIGAEAIIEELNFDSCKKKKWFF